MDPSPPETADFHPLPLGTNHLGNPDPYGTVCDHYLTRLYNTTRRPVIIYYTDWMTSDEVKTQHAIVRSDLQGFMSTVHGLGGDKLDLIINTPGGDPGATEMIVEYLRHKFKHIRVFVPLAALSAGTMLALACDEIIMASHSNLGPIDPQLIVRDALCSTATVLNDFKMAKAEVASDLAASPVWSALLNQWEPGTISRCMQAETLTKELVTKWLRQGRLLTKTASLGPAEVAEWFADAKKHLSHNRSITRQQVRDLGLNVTDLEKDQQLQDAILAVHHSTMLVLTGTNTVKLIDNHIPEAQSRYIVMDPTGTATPPFPLSPDAVSAADTQESQQNYPT